MGCAALSPAGGPAPGPEGTAGLAELVVKCEVPAGGLVGHRGTGPAQPAQLAGARALDDLPLGGGDAAAVPAGAAHYETPGPAGQAAGDQLQAGVLRGAVRLV